MKENNSTTLHALIWCCATTRDKDSFNALINSVSPWNCFGAVNTIPLIDFPSVGVLNMIVRTLTHHSKI